MYKLVIADDDGSKSTVPVIRDEITIGRKEGNTIRLTERNVSRRHARVVRDEEQVYIEDVAARYGIKKNGVKIDQRAEFAPGDVVTIGDYQLTLKAKQPNKAPPKPKESARAPSKPQKKKDEGTQVLPAMPAKLVVVSSNFAGQEFPLNRKEMIIGRGEDCDIIIDHRSVSQKHAKVIREAGNKYQIVDLNSKNGVTIGGEQYRAVHLKRGDVIELGHVKFRFVEPGENYVFTPQPELDELDFEPSSSNNGAKLVAILVAAALIGAGIFYFMSPPDDADSGADMQASVDDDKAGDDSAAPTPTATAGAGDEPVDNNVDEAIGKARQAIADGELDKAIGALDSAKDYLDPSPEQNDKIAELLGTARTEKPFKREYEAARERLQDGEFGDALERLNEIPRHSVFHKLYTKEGLLEQAVDGLLVEAEDAFEDKDHDTARSLAEEALVHDGAHEGARALLERIDEEEERQAKAHASATKNPSNSSNSGSTSGSSRQGSSSSRSGSSSSGSKDDKKTKPAPSGVSPEEAKALLASAQKKVMRKDSSSAIADCQKAVKGGQVACYRIMGLAYKQMGNTSQACSNFKRYLSSNASAGRSGVQREIEKLGCN
jgi:ABC transport system ATP-binding/permease protein